jgi:transposase
MKQIPRSIYTKEFREQAAALVIRDGLSASEAAKRLSMSKKTLENWIGKARSGKLSTVGANRAPVSERDAELSRLRKELAEVKMERDLLKKAAAYFARESLPGTRS